MLEKMAQMRTRTIVLMCALLVGVGSIIGFTAVQAQAAGCADGACTRVDHAFTDDGYGDGIAITVQCADGHSVYVRESENSQTRADGNGCADAKRVYMHWIGTGQSKHEVMKCQPLGSNTFVMIAPNVGWNNINWDGYRNCVLQAQYAV